ADLRGADLSSADLRGADLIGANRVGVRDHGEEQADVREEVGDQIDQDAAQADVQVGDDADQHVARLRDGRVSQQALDVVLPDRQHIAHDHCHHSNRGQHRRPVAYQPLGCEGREEHPQHRRKRSGFGRHGHVRGHRCRSALIDVGCPHMERCHRCFKAKTDDQQADPHQQQRAARSGNAGDRRQVCAPARPVHQGDAVQEKGRGKGTQQ
ncbi:MAG: hypothetical protein C4345_06905, partial [Chloroflexota bacterium]